MKTSSVHILIFGLMLLRYLHSRLLFRSAIDFFFYDPVWK